MPAALRSIALALALSACGGAAVPAPAPSAELGTTPHPNRVEHLYGLTEEAFPELAPIWPALSARAATEVTELLRIEEDRATHCLSVVVVGDLAVEARIAWRRGAESADYECQTADGELRCEAESRTLRLWEDGGGEDDPVALEALAAEMGVEEEPASSAMACVTGLGPSRLASIDARLHRAALLEPWEALHERLGARRFVELAWTHGEARGEELRVRYRGDEEAFELAAEWARSAGLAGTDGVWQLVGEPISYALELRAGEAPEIELTLTREP